MCSLSEESLSPRLILAPSWACQGTNKLSAPFAFHELVNDGQLRAASRDIDAAASKHEVERCNTPPRLLGLCDIFKSFAMSCLHDTSVLPWAPSNQLPCASSPSPRNPKRLPLAIHQTHLHPNICCLDMVPSQTCSFHRRCSTAYGLACKSGATNI